MKMTALAHLIWKKYLTKGASVIDATCGNGLDTLFLAKQILDKDEGKLYAFDIQKEAIDCAKRHTKDHLSSSIYSRIDFRCASHETFVGIEEESIQLICYNLGYLPGGNKEIITSKETTIKSVKAAIDLLKKGGLISLLCYIGHEGGQVEYEAIDQFVDGLDKRRFFSFKIKSNARLCPLLLFVEKIS